MWGKKNKQTLNNQLRALRNVQTASKTSLKAIGVSTLRSALWTQNGRKKSKSWTRDRQTLHMLELMISLRIWDGLQVQDQTFLASSKPNSPRNKQKASLVSQSGTVKVRVSQERQLTSRWCELSSRIIWKKSYKLEVNSTQSPWSC